MEEGVSMAEPCSMTTTSTGVCSRDCGSMGVDRNCDETCSTMTGGGTFEPGRWMDGCSGAIDVASELTPVFSSEPESFLGGERVLVGWLTAPTEAERFVTSSSGVWAVSFLDLTRPGGGLSSDGVCRCVLDLDSRVLTRLADFESLSSFLSSSRIVSTVTGFDGDDLDLPAVRSVSGGLGGPLLMMRLRLANFSLDALMSVEGGVNMSTPGRGAVDSLLCSFENDG